MRTVELARAAADAEKLRLQRMARRQGMRAAYGAVAAVFGLAMLVLLHVILYLLLTLWVGPIWAAVIVFVADLVLAGIFAVMARRNTPDAIEEEAKMLRDQSLMEMRQSITLMSLAGSATELLLRRRRPETTRGRVFGELASRLLSRR